MSPLQERPAIRHPAAHRKGGGSRGTEIQPNSHHRPLVHLLCVYVLM